MQLERNIEVFSDQLQALQTKHKISDYRLGKLINSSGSVIARWKKSSGNQQKVLPNEEFYSKVVQVFQCLENGEEVQQDETEVNKYIEEFSTDALMKELKRRGYTVTISM